MGIRISKSIGYHLPKNKISSILVKNYEEIMENLDYEDDLEQKFFDSLMPLADQLLNPDSSAFILAKMEIKHILEAYKNKKLKSYDLIRLTQNYDDFWGVTFYTNNLYRQSRHDNSIDYYEAQGDINGHIQYLNAPIYPVQGYVYHGGLETEETFDIVEKEVVVEHLSYYARIINKKFYDGKKNVDKHHYKLLTEKGIFTPVIDEVIYILAKASGILKEDITPYIFNKTVKPAILTTWG